LNTIQSVCQQIELSHILGQNALQNRLAPRRARKNDCLNLRERRQEGKDSSE
jgi:hypothetical protein